jgi:hypothetical protein
MYKLKNPIPIYNKETGDYVGAETVVVEFKGKKGLVSLLRMREEVYSIIRESSKGQSPSPDNENESVVYWDWVLQFILNHLNTSPALECYLGFFCLKVYFNIFCN